MKKARFWLHWSLRDLRQRWVLVLAIALVIALGTGAFAGMASMTTWRREAVTASLELLRMHDLRVALGEGASVHTGRFHSLVRMLDEPSVIADASERLVVPVSVDASTADRVILVPGVLVGLELADDGPPVDRVEPDVGRALAPMDDGTDTVLLEYRFARFHELPEVGTVKVAGQTVDYVGQATTPEMLIVATDDGALFSESNYAGVFAGLGTAQALTGLEGQVNELVIRITPDADAADVAADLERAAAEAMPGVGIVIHQREDDPAYRMLTQDIDADERFFLMFALIILGGAALATYNLTSRIVDAQRRQIGIGMALGLGDRELALRPVMMGAGIALAGVALGIVVGMLLNVGILALLERFLPMPVFEAPLLPGPFITAATVGFLVPFVATLLPVRRAIRMPPVEAIHAGPRSVRSAGLAALASRLPLPSGTIARTPFRNILRSPRRSVLTSLGIGAAIGVLVAMSSMVDSFEATIERGETALLGQRSDRLIVELAGFVPLDVVERVVRDEPAVASATAGLRVGGHVAAKGRDLDVLIQLVDLSDTSTGWAPPVSQGHTPERTGDGPGGILLAEEAASDLGIGLGDVVRLTHPRRSGPTTVEMVETEVVVSGFHPNPIRTIAYLDIADADLMGAAGLVNIVDVVPAEGASEDDVARALFGQPGVTSVQPVAQVARVYRDLVEEFTDILVLIQGVALLMALLVAFNSASIANDERAREHATMLAFGLPVRRVLGMEVVENVLLGVGGTLVGLAVGVLVLNWIIEVELPNTMPDLGILVSVAPMTVAIAVLVGVVVVGLAPLLMVRRLRRM
ncbi:MAG: ABC transporter permease, partial [Chloroflexota bacterium]